MNCHVLYVVRGAGRLGSHPANAPYDLLLAGADTGRSAIGAIEGELRGSWPDDDEFQAQLAAAGWDVRPPRRSRVLGITTVSCGELQANAVVTDAEALRRMVSTAAESDFGMLNLEVRLGCAYEDRRSLALRFSEQTGVLEVTGYGADCEAAVAAVKATIERDAPLLGLRLTEPRGRC